MMGMRIMILKKLNKVKTIKILFFFFLFNSTNAQISSSTILSDLNIVLEQAYSDSINFDNKLKSLKKHYYLLNKIENDSTRLRNKFKVVNRVIHLRDLKHELEFLTDIKFDAYDVKDSYNIARFHNYLGDYFLTNYKLDSALYHINKSEKLFLEIGDKTYLSYNYRSKAQLFLDINDYNKALEYDFLSLKLAEEENKINAMFWAYSNIFTTQGKLKNEEKTFEYYEKAMQVLEDNKEELQNIYYTSKPEKQNLLGVALEEMGNYALAEQYYKEAASAENLMEIYPSLHAALIDNLAYIRYLQGDSLGVKKELEHALFLKDSLNKPGLTVKTKYRLAKLHYDSGELEKSKEYAYKALNTAKTHNQTSYVLQSIQQLALSEPEKQAEHFQEYIRLNDSIINAERVQRDKFARIEYETEQLEKDNIQAKLDNQKLANRNIIIASAGLFSLMLLGFAYYNYRKKAQRKLFLLEQQEQETKAEILDLIMHQKQAVAKAKTEEQNRIAKDLHDDISGTLSSLNLQLHVFGKKHIPEEGKALFEKYTNQIKDTKHRVREISHELSQDKRFEKMDFDLAIQGLIKTLKDIGIQAKVKYNTAFNWTKVSLPIKLESFRILQEGITNISKYAEASEVNLHFLIENNTYSFELSDNGIGFDTSSHKSRGIGLKNMQKRAKEINANLEIKSQANQGTKIKLSVALPKVEKSFF